MESGKRKKQQLGMPVGTAFNRLRKLVMFKLLKQSKQNICYRCKKKIQTSEELSIEHKKAWLDNDVKLFWDLNNIGFSHLSCNVRHKRRPPLVHNSNAYNWRKCRCEVCKIAHSKRMKKQREARKANIPQ